MRLTKWRGKRACEGLHNGEWIEGALCDLEECAKEDYTYILRENGALYRVYKDTVGEYLNMVDARGKELWEFDVVGTLYTQQRDAVIVHSDGAFRLLNLENMDIVLNPEYCRADAMRALYRKGSIFDKELLQNRAGMNVPEMIKETGYL